MASSSYQTTGEKKQKNSNTIINPCRTLVTTGADHSNNLPKPSLSYFISFSIKSKSRSVTDPLMEVKIKIPQLLIKSPKKYPGNLKLVPKRFTSFLSEVLNRKKSSSDSKSVNDGDGDSNDCNTTPWIEEYAEILEIMSDTDDSDSFMSARMSSDSEDGLYWLASESPLPEISSSKSEIPEIKDEIAKEKSTLDRSIVLPKLISPKMSFSSFTKKTLLILSKGKSGILKGSIGRGRVTGGDGGNKRFGKLTRFLINRKMMKIFSSVKKEDCRRTEDNEKGQLCKKRILMGERSRRRPLELLGFHNYDEFGNPLPEFPASGGTIRYHQSV